MSDYDCCYDHKFVSSESNGRDYPDEYYDEAYDSWLDRQRMEKEDEKWTQEHFGKYSR